MLRRLVSNRLNAFGITFEAVSAPHHELTAVINYTEDRMLPSVRLLVGLIMRTKHARRHAATDPIQLAWAFARDTDDC